MKVCAHYNIGGNQWFHRHNSIMNAVDDLVESHAAMGFETIPGVQTSAVTVSPQCDDCTTFENHHDYPHAAYSIGVRGGLVKEAI